MKYQAIFLDSNPKNFNSNEFSLVAQDFLMQNIKDFHQPSSILVSNRSSADLREFESLPSLTVVQPIGPTRGALATAMLAVDFMSIDSPIVLIPTNSHLKRDVFFNFLEQMIRADYFAGTMCVRSTNPRFSYIRVHDEKVIEVVEKKVVGNLATTGVFFFKSKEILMESAKWSFVNNQTTNSIFYIAPCLNYAISKGLEIGYYVASENTYVHAD